MNAQHPISKGTTLIYEAIALFPKGSATEAALIQALHATAEFFATPIIESEATQTNYQDRTPEEEAEEAYREYEEEMSGMLENKLQWVG